MSALAAVLNKAAPGDKVIELYSVSPTAQLHLYLKAGDDAEDGQNEFGSADTKNYQGIIFNPSFIAAAQFRDINMVFAVTNPPKGSSQGPSQTNDISLVAPVYDKLANTTYPNKKVAATTDGKHTWLYYLDGTTENMIIKQLHMGSKNIDTFPKGAAVRPGDSLGACFDADRKERLVIYHKITDGERCLTELNVDQLQDYNIESTSNARETTALAMTYHRGTVYLYYVDTNNHLQRVTKKNQKWGSSNRVHGAAKVAAGSQLAVVTANGNNHIFFATTSGSDSEVNHFRDPVDKE